MVSLVNTSFPIVGIDQPSQGFRDNFSTIKVEIEALQTAQGILITDVATAQSDIFTLQSTAVQTINDLSDVDVTTVPPINGDFLIFDGTNWKTTSIVIPTSIGNLNDVDTISSIPLNGQVLTYNGTLWTPQDNIHQIAIEDEGSAVGVFQTLNFVGSGVTAVLDGGNPSKSIITITSIANLAEDLTPQLGGNLDAQTFQINNLADPTLAQDAATKNYVDTQIIAGAGISNIVQDLTPQLGGNLDAQTFQINNLADPILAQDAATKAYVDSVAAGLDPKASVKLATTSNLTGFSFINNGGVGDTLVASTTGLTTVDSIILSDGDRVLIKDQTSPTQNGIYVASNTSNSLATILTRATDQDGSPSNEVSGGNFTFVEAGTLNAGTGWVVLGSGILTINTDPINWSIFTRTNGALLNIVEDLTPQLGGTLDALNNKIINLLDPTLAQDAATKNYVDNQIITGSLQNIIEDITPQLGGNLDAQNFQINNLLDPTLAQDAATKNYVDTQIIANAGLQNIVEDLTPQLGGNLDVQTFSINTSITNGDISIIPDGTGSVLIGNNSSTSPIITSNDATIGSGLNGQDITISSGTGDGIGNGGDIIILPGGSSGSGVSGLVRINGLVWPITDGVAGQIIQTDGLGNLSFGTFLQATGTELQNIVEDLTPQLGGDLDVNGKSIVSVAGGNIVITPDTTGVIILDSLNWPTADGLANQVLTTDGLGNLSFTDVVRSNNNNTFTKAQRNLPINVLSNTLLTLDFDSGNNFEITIATNFTLDNPINMANAAGQSGNIIIVQDGTGSRLLTATGTFWNFPGGILPTLSTTPGAVDMIKYYVRNSTFIIAEVILDIK